MTDSTTGSGDLVRDPAATGTVTMYPKLERREWIFTPAPDPRDARIAELEAEIEASNSAGALVIEVARQRDAGYKARIAELELALSPERDMAITVEELDA